MGRRLGWAKGGSRSQVRGWLKAMVAEVDLVSDSLLEYMCAERDDAGLREAKLVDLSTQGRGGRHGCTFNLASALEDRERSLMTVAAR